MDIDFTTQEMANNLAKLDELELEAHTKLREAHVQVVEKRIAKILEIEAETERVKNMCDGGTPIPTPQVNAKPSTAYEEYLSRRIAEARKAARETPREE